jgi:hypothetical protein
MSNSQGMKMNKLASVEATNEVASNKSQPAKNIANQKKRQAHFIMQPKGGVGKSLVAILVAQYLRDNGFDMKGMDTDTSNHTFTLYRDLKVKHIPLLDKHLNLDVQKFDSLLATLLTEEGCFVIDNGSNSIMQLKSYLIQMDALQLLKDAGVEVFMHNIIVGDDSMNDMIITFDEFCTQLDAKFIVWLNEYKGEVKPNGKDFHETPVFQQHKDKIKGLVYLNDNGPMFINAIAKMTTKRLTFAQVKQDESIDIVSKIRIEKSRKETYDQLDQMGF